MRGTGGSAAPLSLLSPMHETPMHDGMLPRLVSVRRIRRQVAYCCSVA